MELGTFSNSLAVKDIAASKSFYETLGFAAIMGTPEENWLIMRNGKTTIGLFQGMFENNIMTFNPGWDADAQPLDSYEDIRDIQGKLKNAGATLVSEVEEGTTGPASFMVMDPDGNTILFDQHV